MILDNIRRVFSKGNIVLSPEGISVIYTHKDGWVTQSLSVTPEEYDWKQTILGLLEKSERFGISYRAGKFVKFLFENHGVCEEYVLYPPLDHEVSLEEFLASIEDEPMNEEFFDFFLGVDLSDDDEVIQKFLEYCDSFKYDGLFIGNTRRWLDYRKAVVEFAMALGAEVEVFEPDAEFSGAVEIRFPEEIRKTIWFSEKSTGELQKIITDSSEMCIECNVSDGFLNITFYI